MGYPSALRRYGVALLAVLVASVLRYYLNPILGARFPLLLHAFAIALAAQYGGTIPGLTATVLGVWVTAFFFMPPIYHFRVSDPGDILALSVFTLVGVSFSIFGGRRAALLTKLQALTHDLRQRIEEQETVIAVAPAAIWVSKDPECLEIIGNPMANRFYEAGAGENVSAGPSAPSESTLALEAQSRRFFRDGVELKAEELPMQQAAAQNRDVRNAELEVLLPSGHRIEMLGHASPLRDAAGAVRGCVGAFLDITELKQRERAIHALNAQLEDSNRMLNLALKAGKSGVWELNLETGNLLWTEEYSRMLGIDPSTKPSLELFFSLIHPDDQMSVKDNIEQSIQNRAKDFHSEFRIALPDGAHWIERRGQVICDSSGKPVRMIGINTDVTERRILRGLLPTCAHCKKIRDEQGNWQRLEKYIGDHSNAQFSHGLCPDCLKEHFPDVGPAGVD
jgi:PAS domain S-box-containing protein